jgi:hypothetical protein
VGVAVKTGPSGPLGGGVLEQLLATNEIVSASSKNPPLVSSTPPRLIE